MSFTITCPICGKRDAYEFRYGNEERGGRPDEEGITAETFSDYVFLKWHSGRPRQEWWYHRDGCGSWFTIRRDPMTNREWTAEDVLAPEEKTI
jgi:heterotetrameric sarcosine oxidase delta subunit